MLAINISDFLFSRRIFSLPFLNIFRGLLTDDHSPGNFSAGQSILLQSCVSGPSGFVAAQFESGNVLYWPLDTCCRHKILRVWTPLPHVLEQGRQPDTYQLKQANKCFHWVVRSRWKNYNHTIFSVNAKLLCSKKRWSIGRVNGDMFAKSQSSSSSLELFYFLESAGTNLLPHVA